MPARGSRKHYPFGKRLPIDWTIDMRQHETADASTSGRNAGPGWNPEDERPYQACPCGGWYDRCPACHGWGMIVGTDE